MLFDANAFIGTWPFDLNPELTAGQLVARLKECAVSRAAVSHLDAVFQPEPMPANRRLFAACRKLDALTPVPVINPHLAHWRDQLRECAEASGVRAVRVIPNYHGYRLTSRRMTEFAAELPAFGLKLVVTARLEDPRQRYFALAIRPVPLADLRVFLSRCREVPVLCTALTLGEIITVAQEFPETFADLSFAEHVALADRLRGKAAADRLMFGTLVPMISARAQTAKLSATNFTVAEARAIGSANARRFFSP